jgi:hypothetical protein
MKRKRICKYFLTCTWGERNNVKCPHQVPHTTISTDDIEHITKLGHTHWGWIGLKTKIAVCSKHAFCPAPTDVLFFRPHCILAEPRKKGGSHASKN